MWCVEAPPVRLRCALALCCAACTTHAVAHLRTALIFASTLRPYFRSLSRVAYPHPRMHGTLCGRARLVFAISSSRRGQMPPGVFLLLDDLFSHSTALSFTMYCVGQYHLHRRDRCNRCVRGSSHHSPPLPAGRCAVGDICAVKLTRRLAASGRKRGRGGSPMGGNDERENTLNQVSKVCLQGSATQCRAGTPHRQLLKPLLAIRCST